MEEGNIEAGGVALLVSAELEARLRREAEQRQATVPELIAEALDALVGASASAPTPSIWERLVALADEVPDEEMAGRPNDIAAQHDHYLYGTPEANEAVDVDVTPLAERSGSAHNDQGRRMAAALERLAQLETRSLPSDPVAWEREVREDRKLPGRGGDC
jgi:hypothetical protein